MTTTNSPSERGLSGFEQCLEVMSAVLGEIARGRKDNGRPLGGETARQMARECLDSLDLEWPRSEVR